MVSIKLGLKQFIIPQRCNFPPATPPSVTYLLPSQDVWVTNTPPLLGLRCLLFTHASCWRWVLFVCLCCPYNPHVGVETPKPSHAQTGGGGGVVPLLLVPCVVSPAAGGLVPGGEGVPRWRWQGQWFLALAGFKPGFVLYSGIFFFVSTITVIYYSFTLFRDDSKISLYSPS